MITWSVITNEVW